MKTFQWCLCVLLIALCVLAPPAEPVARAEEAAAEDMVAFDPSEGIDEGGLWTGVAALSLVELCEHQGILIPASVHAVPAEEVQAQIDALLEQCATEVYLTDRAVAMGDTVNIDYVGSVDGVAFEGGSTDGLGTEVTIGLTAYIDDFLEQLVGHMPGETIEVAVTFPADYGVDALDGKDAVFVTTIHHIVTFAEPQLTDELVAENFAQEGWTTVAQMRAEIEAATRDNAVRDYIIDYIVGNSMVAAVPQALLDYQRQSMLSYYQDYAALYGMELAEFLSDYAGYDSVDALVAEYGEYMLEVATYDLIVQAIAEELQIVVGQAQVLDYFARHLGVDDPTEYQDYYGAPFLAQVTLHQLVMDNLLEGARYE